MIEGRCDSFEGGLFLIIRGIDQPGTKMDSFAKCLETIHVGALEHGQIIHIARAAPYAGGMRLAADLGSRCAFNDARKGLARHPQR